MHKPKGLLVQRERESLSEASLSRVYKHWLDSGFAALTSWRHFYRGADRRPIPDAVNQRKLAELKRAVRSAGFGFIPLDSVWKEQGKELEEPSILVPAIRKGEVDVDELRTLALKLGRKFDQDSILMVEPGGKGAVLSTQPATFGDVEVPFKSFHPNDLNWLYSKLHGQDRAFWLESAPASFSEAQLRFARGEIPRGSQPVDFVCESGERFRAIARSLETDYRDALLAIDDGASTTEELMHAMHSVKRITRDGALQYARSLGKKGLVDVTRGHDYAGNVEVSFVASSLGADVAGWMRDRAAVADAEMKALKAKHAARRAARKRNESRRAR